MTNPQQGQPIRAFFSEEDGVVAEIETVGDKSHSLTVSLINLCETGIGANLDKAQAAELSVGSYVYIRSIRVKPKRPGAPALRIKVANTKIRGIHACVKWVTENKYTHHQVAGFEFTSNSSIGSMRTLVRKFMDALPHQAA